MEWSNDDQHHSAPPKNLPTWQEFHVLAMLAVVWQLVDVACSAQLFPLFHTPPLPACTWQVDSEPKQSDAEPDGKAGHQLGIRSSPLSLKQAIVSPASQKGSIVSAVPKEKLSRY